LLARDRGEDPDVGGSEGVRQVVLELGDLGHLDPRGEAKLVAGDVGAGDGADDLGGDAEVPERLDQAGRRLLLAGGVRPGLLGAREAFPAGRTASGSGSGFVGSGPAAGSARSGSPSKGSGGASTWVARMTSSPGGSGGMSRSGRGLATGRRGSAAGRGVRSVRVAATMLSPAART